MIAVRAATIDDTDRLLELAEEMDRFYGAVDVESLERRRVQIHDALFNEAPAAECLLALDGETLMGFAAYSYLWPAVGLTRSLFLKELYVSRSHRRQGIGKALMQSLFDVAKRSRCSRVEWMTDDDNKNAQAFYGSVGVAPDQGKIFYRLEG